MALAVQQSLFEAGGGASRVESAHCIEGLMLGEIALGLCAIAVAFIGGLSVISCVAGRLNITPPWL